MQQSAERGDAGEGAVLLHISTLRAVTSGETGSIIRRATRGTIRNPSTPDTGTSGGSPLLFLLFSFAVNFYRLRTFFALPLRRGRRVGACMQYASQLITRDGFESFNLFESPKYFSLPIIFNNNFFCTTALLI